MTTSFLCAAAFVAVLNRYGLVEACLTGAGIFFVVTLLAAGLYAARKQQTAKRIADVPKQAKSSIQSMMPDPMVIASALPIIRAIGLKKLVPILAIGALAFGLSRPAAPAEATMRPWTNPTNDEICAIKKPPDRAAFL